MGGGRGLRGQRWGAGNRLQGGGYINPCIAHDRAPALPAVTWLEGAVDPPPSPFPTPLSFI